MTLIIARGDIESEINGLRKMDMKGIRKTAMVYKTVDTLWILGSVKIQEVVTIFYCDDELVK